MSYVLSRRSVLHLSTLAIGGTVASGQLPVQVSVDHAQTGVRMVPMTLNLTVTKPFEASFDLWATNGPSPQLSFAGSTTCEPGQHTQSMLWVSNGRFQLDVEINGQRQQYRVGAGEHHLSVAGGQIRALVQSGDHRVCNVSQFNSDPLEDASS
jgi:hypothetical protein